MRIDKPCDHGVPFSDYCIDCDIVWHSDCLATATATVVRHSEKLTELLAKRAAPPAKPETPGPGKETL